MPNFNWNQKVEKDAAVAAHRFLVDVDVIRLVKNAFEHCFKEARLSTTGGSDIEHNKYVGQSFNYYQSFNK